MINRLIKDPTATTGSETVSDTLAGMMSYAQEHFKSEERLMIKHGYPQFEQHESEHLVFWEKVVELSEDAQNAIESVPEVLLGYLKQWLYRHILHEDMKYKQFFEEKGVSD